MEGLKHVEGCAGRLVVAVVTSCHFITSVDAQLVEVLFLLRPVLIGYYPTSLTASEEAPRPITDLQTCSLLT